MTRRSASRRSRPPQQPDPDQWVAARAARRATALRDEIVSTLAHPLFKGCYAQSIVAEVARLLNDADGTDAYDADTVLRHYRGLFGADLDTADPASIAASTWEMLARTAEAMRSSEVFIAAPAMHRTVIAAANTVTWDDTMEFSEADVGWPTGLLVFPATVCMHDARGVAEMEALSWRVTPDGDGNPALMMQFWTRGGWENPVMRGKLRPSSMQLTLDQATVGSHAGVPVEWVSPGVLAGDEPPPPQWYGPDHDYRWTAESCVEDLVVKYVYAFLRLADQKVMTSPAMRDGSPAGGPPSHADAGALGGVRVAQLRRATAPHSGATAGSVEWKHSWVVGMHRVRQWYPSLNAHKTIFRGPYVKGPADAPMLLNETVHALLR